MVRIQSATITVNYLTGGYMGESPCYPWPEDARAAFEYGASIWESLIDSSVSISINACWSELEEGILGSSGAHVVNEVKVYQIHRSKSVPPCDEISALFCHRVNKPLLSF
jgi:hypothetical protein